MSKTSFPPGWEEERVYVLDYYESQTDEEAAEEHDAAHRSSMYAFMEVPIELVPAVHLRRFGRLSVDFGESRSTYI